MTSLQAYDMSSALIARAAAHRLRELGAAEVTVMVSQRSDTRGHTLVAARVSGGDAAEAEADRLIRGLDPGAVYVGSSLTPG
jgi:hypothetical protein